MSRTQTHKAATPNAYDLNTINSSSTSSNSSSSTKVCRSCCSCCCCSSGGCCGARAATTELPLPAGTPLMLEETWDIVGAATQSALQHQAAHQRTICVARVAGISSGGFEDFELLRGGQDPRRFLLVDTTQLHRRPQLERCGCYQFIGPLILLPLHQHQLRELATSLEASSSQQSDILAAAAASSSSATSERGTSVCVPLLRARVSRRVDGFDFAQYKLALRLLRAIEPQTEPAAAAAASDAGIDDQQQTQELR